MVYEIKLKLHNILRQYCFFSLKVVALDLFNEIIVGFLSFFKFIYLQKFGVLLIEVKIVIF